MPTVADVLRRYGEEYLEQFGATMPGEHNKVLRAITACRTGALGTVLYACESCGRTHAVGRSCGNRHCPSCQQDKARDWLEDQIERLLRADRSSLRPVDRIRLLAWPAPRMLSISPTSLRMSRLPPSWPNSLAPEHCSWCRC